MVLMELEDDAINWKAVDSRWALENSRASQDAQGAAPAPPSRCCPVLCLHCCLSQSRKRVKRVFHWYLALRRERKGVWCGRWRWTSACTRTCKHTHRRTPTDLKREACQESEEPMRRPFHQVAQEEGKTREARGSMPTSSGDKHSFSTITGGLGHRGKVGYSMAAGGVLCCV